MLWSLYREVSDICSWQKCYYHKLTLNGPLNNRYLYSETRLRLLLDETQASGKGSTTWVKFAFPLHQDNLTQFSGTAYNFFYSRATRGEFLECLLRAESIDPSTVKRGLKYRKRSIICVTCKEVRFREKIWAVNPGLHVGFCNDFWRVSMDSSENWP